MIFAITKAKVRLFAVCFMIKRHMEKTKNEKKKFFCIIFMLEKGKKNLCVFGNPEGSPGAAQHSRSDETV